MELNHAMARDGDEVLRRELQHVRHDAEIRVEATQGLARLVGLQGAELIDRNAMLLRSEPQWVGWCPRLLRGAKHARNRIAAGKECVQYRFAEVSLSYDGNTLYKPSPG